MVGKTTFLLPLAAFGTSAALSAAQPLPTLAQTQPGLWEVSGVPGVKAPVRQCVFDLQLLARFEHRAKPCTSRIVKNSGSLTAIDYSCAGGGFGHSDIQVITPRSLRIATQGISDGLPFNYVLQARRVGDCQKSASASRH